MSRSKRLVSVARPGCLVLVAMLALCLSSCSVGKTGAPDGSSAVKPAGSDGEELPTSVVGTEDGGDRNLATPYPTDSGPRAILKFTVGETAEVLLGKLRGSRDCRLPCLMGLNPGSTRHEDIGDLLDSLQEGSTELVVVKLPPPEMRTDRGGVTLVIASADPRKSESWRDTQLDLGYYFDGTDTLQTAELGLAVYESSGTGATMERQYAVGAPEMLQAAESYSLSSLLAEYGVPSLILVAPFPYENEPWPKPEHLPFSVVLVYEETGFLIEYILTLQENEREYFACPEDLWEMTLVAWDPAARPGLEESLRHKDGLGLNANLVRTFETIQDASGLELHQFHELFSDPSTDTCISAPKSLWVD